MKKLYYLFVASVTFLFCSFIQPSDDVLLDGYDEETKENLISDTILGNMGQIYFPECHATITVPEGFVYLNKDETKRLLIEYWNNPEDRIENNLGALVPNTAKAYYQISVAYVISYDNCGYIKDEDANDVDYEQMMKDIQESEVEENKNLPLEQRLTTMRWEYEPKYLAGSHTLVWAKHLSSAGGEVINYDMRILGKDGYVSLMAVVDPEDSQEVKQKEQSVINSLSFDNGYAYSDFDSSRDKVSEWTIGGLVAGSIIAKTGLLAKIGLFILKGWKIIAVAVAGISGFLFKKKKEKKENQ